MEKIKAFIELCEKREALAASCKMTNSLFSDYQDKQHQQLTKEILEVADELGIIGLSKSDKYEVQIYELHVLQAICRNVKSEVLPAEEADSGIWYRYTAEVDNIVFQTLEKVSKEEHKKAQAM